MCKFNDMFITEVTVKRCLRGFYIHEGVRILETSKKGQKDVEECLKTLNEIKTDFQFLLQHKPSSACSVVQLLMLLLARPSDCYITVAMGTGAVSLIKAPNDVIIIMIFTLIGLFFSPRDSTAGGLLNNIYIRNLFNLLVVHLYRLLFKYSLLNVFTFI